VRALNNGWLRAIGVVLAAKLIILAPGCGRQEVQVYQIPKQQPLPVHHHGMGGMETALPKIRFKLPDGWQDKGADNMRAARLAVAGKDGRQGEVSVMPMAGISAQKEEILNIWRQQLGLNLLGPGEADKLRELVEVGTLKGELYELTAAGGSEAEQDRPKTLVVLAQQGQIHWFFKMSGPDALIRESKPAFLDFLKSVEFQTSGSGGASAEPKPAAATRDGTAPLPSWQVPEGWQAQDAPPMVRAKFILPASGQSQAEVTVSDLAGSGGDKLLNLNRWRGQLSLAPITAGELEKHVTELEVSGSKAMLAEMEGVSARTGKPARMVVVSVPKDGVTWFFKLMGDAAVVEKEKNNFLQFVKSCKFTTQPAS